MQHTTHEPTRSKVPVVNGWHCELAVRHVSLKVHSALLLLRRLLLVGSGPSLHQLVDVETRCNVRLRVTRSYKPRVSATRLHFDAAFLTLYIGVLQFC